MEVRLDIKIAVRHVLAWVVTRVGEPDQDFQTDSTEIPYPDLIVPVNKDHKIHESLATVRYPLGSDDVSKLIQLYKLVVSRMSMSDAASGLNVTVPTQMMKYSQMASWRARYLFGEGERKADHQLAEFAYRMAIMTNELFRCPLVASGNNFFTKCSGKPTFGIESGRLIGVRDYPINVPEKELLTPSVATKQIRSNAILCLYDKAVSLGEHEAMFAIQSAVWLNGKSAVTLQSEIERKYPGKSGARSCLPGRRPKAGTSAKPKVLITDSTYQSALNIVKCRDNPRHELYRLLVPWAVSDKYYRAHFANINITSKISDGMRQKMLDALNQLYAGS